jgi:RNA polymerase subunit RPABC4/transcription elongation factor Spt4
MSSKSRRPSRYCRGCHRGISRSARTCPICLKRNLTLTDYVLLTALAAACVAVAVWAMRDWASYYRNDQRGFSYDRAIMPSK